MNNSASQSQNSFFQSVIEEEDAIHPLCELDDC